MLEFIIKIAIEIDLTLALANKIIAEIFKNKVIKDLNARNQKAVAATTERFYNITWAESFNSILSIKLLARHIGFFLFKKSYNKWLNALIEVINYDLAHLSIVPSSIKED